MAGPRTFVVKKTVPGMSSTKISDRNTQLEVQNIIENIKSLEARLNALQEQANATNAVVASGDGESSTAPLTDAELYDDTNVPADPPLPYLRFERDGDGDIQTIYLGTVD